jgi:hypothetical protein
MAITHIHAIYTEPDACLDYCEEDKADERKLTKDDVADALDYAASDKVGDNTCPTLNSYHNCVKGGALQKFRQLMKAGRGKLRREEPRTKNGKEVVAWHLIQSFDGCEVPPQIANEIGLKLAKKVFRKFACSISTHTNTDNIHNHILICAWDKTGRKWNDCQETKRLIRRESDRLCEEYGLSVLEDTRNMSLSHYIDRDGIVRAVEVTPRKIKAWEEYNEGKRDIADANDYRQSDAYKTTLAKKRSNIDVIRSDIDNLLPVVRSYDELLERLRNMGYEINAKRKNGGWRKHVAFKAAGQAQGRRDYQLGEDGFYTREKLTAYIESGTAAPEHSASPHREDVDGSVDDVPYVDYEYGKTNFDDINDEFRAGVDDDGNKYVVKRSEPEKKIIGDIRILDRSVKKQIDTSGLKKVIAEIDNAKKAKNRYYAKNNTEKLIMEIQERFENLKFIERNNIYSYEQLNGLYKAVFDRHNQTVADLAKLDGIAGKLEHLLALPDKIAVLNSVMQANKDNPEYMLEEYAADAAKLRRYKALAAKHGLNRVEDVSKLKSNLADAKGRIELVRAQLERGKAELSDYERCIRVLDHIDSKSNTRNEAAVNEFNEIKRHGRAKEKARGKARASSGSQ